MLRLQQNLDRVLFFLYGIKIFESEEINDLDQDKKTAEISNSTAEITKSKIDRVRMPPQLTPLELIHESDFLVSSSKEPQKTTSHKSGDDVDKVEIAQWRKIREELDLVKDELEKLKESGFQKKKPNGAVLDQCERRINELEKKWSLFISLIVDKSRKRQKLLPHSSTVTVSGRMRYQRLTMYHNPSPSNHQRNDERHAEEVDSPKSDFGENGNVLKLKAENEKLKRKLAEVKANYFKEMVMRKKYFNMAEDLKGKIRVYCRIKPTREDQTFLECPDDYTVRYRTRRVKYEFMFDGVFTSQHTQEDIYHEIQNLLESVLDGYNLCIFAYGQTGSGKTHTLVGNSAQPGIAPRAFSRIFELIRNSEAESTFRVSASFLELYNERLIDLLNGGQDEKLKIRMDANGYVYVEGSERLPVRDEAQLSMLFQEACRQRHTASTKMNIESSRSHLIVAVTVESKNKTTGVIHKGKLSIVDLAGSERSGKASVKGKQLKESNSINKSLSALGDVIAALTMGYNHVPYRNNKLTFLMQDSLGGNAKTLMFVTIAATEKNLQESLNSLTYASRVKQVTNSAKQMTNRKDSAWEMLVPVTVSRTDCTLDQMLLE